MLYVYLIYKAVDGNRNTFAFSTQNMKFVWNQMELSPLKFKTHIILKLHLSDDQIHIIWFISIVKTIEIYFHLNGNFINIFIKQ